jgi:hypothetical protein
MARNKPPAVPDQFPQDKIDLMFWQYMSGVVDAIGSDNFATINEKRIEELMKRKLARIAEVYNDRKPTFGLKVTFSNNQFQLSKT